jgi:hypothetical protein
MAVTTAAHWDATSSATSFATIADGSLRANILMSGSSRTISSARPTAVNRFVASGNPFETRPITKPGVRVSMVRL